VFVRQFPRQIEIVSPGGFPPGITQENILERQLPRNRRLAEALGRCGLVERSGQGADRMFRASIREGKPLPEYSESDMHQVVLKLHGEIRDLTFVQFLEKVGNELLASFGVSDFIVLDHVNRGVAIPPALAGRVALLLEKGVIERHGRGKLLLSRRYYTFVGRRGVYTRKRGLRWEKQKALVVQHLENFGRATIREFEDALSELSRSQIHRLLRELRAEGQVRVSGAKRGSAWELVPDRVL
jgi:ATP-dependent DNA helicase RecG